MFIETKRKDHPQPEVIYWHFWVYLGVDNPLAMVTRSAGVEEKKNQMGEYGALNGEGLVFEWTISSDP